MCGYSTAYRSNLTRHKHRCKSVSTPGLSSNSSPASPFTENISIGSSPDSFDTFCVQSTVYAPSRLLFHSETISLPIAHYDDPRLSRSSEEVFRDGINVTNDHIEPPKLKLEDSIGRVDLDQHVKDPHVQQPFYSPSSTHASDHSLHTARHDRQRRIAFPPDRAVNPAMQLGVQDRVSMTFTGSWDPFHGQYTVPPMSASDLSHYSTPDTPIARRGGVVLVQLPSQTDWLTPRFVSEDSADDPESSDNTSMITAGHSHLRTHLPMGYGNSRSEQIRVPRRQSSM